MSTGKHIQTAGDGDAPGDSDCAQWQMWFNTTKDSAVSDALVKVNREIDQLVLEKNPTCLISGRCCDFNAFGHRLYVTGLEISWVIRQLKVNSGPETKHAERLDTGTLTDACTFQVNGMCSIHLIRPFGCRIFFCEDGTQDWQQEIYERYQQRIRQLHDEHQLPYRYMEWRGGLMEANAAINFDG
jgi:Fe-S-cluster containining protein